MDKYISAHPSWGNENPHLYGLPLLDWRPSPQHPPCLLDMRAERLARAMGRPMSVVRIHMAVAGLGGGAR